MQTPISTLGFSVCLGLCLGLVTPACDGTHQALTSNEQLGRTFTGADVPPALGEPEHREACGLTRCAVGEHCCFATGACLPPDALDGCPEPVGAIGTDSAVPPDFPARPPYDFDAGEQPCTTHADCGEDAFCHAPLCLGEGVCRSRSDARCDWPDYDERVHAETADDPEYQKYRREAAQVCGCDGFNYDSECQAWESGVRVATAASYLPCGGLPPPPGDQSLGSVSIDDFSATNPCETDGSCDGNLICCEVTRTCVAGAERCFMPPGPGYPCLDDWDCASDGHYTYYCERPACATQGYCREPEPGPATGGSNAIEPVCGCDGVSYLNPSAAHEAHQSVAHEGECVTP